jgi:hypothetical protein
LENRLFCVIKFPNKLLHLFLGVLSAQATFTSQQFVPSSVQHTTLDQYYSNYKTFTLDLDSLKNYLGSGNNTFQLNISGSTISFNVSPLDIRTPDFNISKVENGETVSLPSKPNNIYAGINDNDNTKKTVFSISEKSIWASFYIGNIRYQIAPISHLINENTVVLVAFSAPDVIQSYPQVCGLDSTTGILGGPPPVDCTEPVSPTIVCPTLQSSCQEVAITGSTGQTGGTIGPRVLPIAPTNDYALIMAVEADYEFYTMFGQDVDIVRDAVLTIASSVHWYVFSEFFYTNIGAIDILIHTTADDPYSSTDGTTAWNELSTHVNQRDDLDCVRYDVMQLFSGKNLNVSGQVNPPGVGAICSNITTPFQNTSTRALAVSRHNNPNLYNSSTVAHEIIHNIGLNYHIDNDLITFNCANEPCGNSSDDLDFLFCDGGDNTGFEAFLAGTQCEIYSRIAGNCCLSQYTPLPSQCENCKISTNFRLSNEVLIPGCDSDNETTITVEVCNDCTAGREIVVKLQYSPTAAEVMERDLSIFPTPPTPPANGFVFIESVNLNFNADECKEFTFKYKLASSVNDNPRINVLLNTEGINDFPSTTGLILNGNNSSTFGSNGIDISLQDLIDNSSLFQEESVACVNGDIKIIELNEDLIIDVPSYCLKGYNFLINDDVKIVVQAGNNLIIEDSDFTSCGNMWDAIELESNASLTVTNSSFKQAINAIRGATGSTIHVTNSTFEDNYIGIKYDGDPTSGDLLVQGCVFKRTNGLNETISGITRPYAGIQVGRILMAQVTGYDNDGVFTNTTFTDLHNGIISNASQFDVADATFNNMVSQGSGASRGINGYGIYQLGSRGAVAGLSVDNGSSPAPSAIFNNCHTAIYASQSHLWVSGIETRNVRNGIETVNCRSRQLRVFRSDIEAKSIGISFVQNQPAIVIVEENDIRINDPFSISFAQGTGILSAENTGYPSYDFNRIRNNTINIDTGREGMRIMGGRFQYLYNNYIYLNNDNGGRKGVQIEGSFRPLLSFNQVFGPDAVNYNSTFGFWVDGISDPDIQCNMTTNLDKGMQFWGLNDNTDLRGNTFNAGGTGLQLGIQNTNGTIRNAAIDGQIHKGNIWDGTFGSGNGAFHASTTFDWWSRSLFEVNDNADPRFYPINNVPGESWIDNDPASTTITFGCPILPPPPSVDGVYSSPTDLEGKITNGEFIVPGYESTSSSIARARLLARWLDPTTTNLNSPKFQQFVTAMNGTMVELLETSRQNLNSAVSIAEADMNNIVDATNKIEQTASALRVTSPSSSRNDLLQEMATFQGTLNSLLVTVDNQRIQSLGQLTWSASSSGGGLSQQIGTSWNSTTEPFIAAEYEVQQLIVKEDNAALDATDSLSLLALAESCPWLNGDAVYQARALYSKLDPVRTFDGDYCSTTAAPLQKSVEELTELSAELFPNPAEDYLLVRLNRPIATKNACRVYDVTGKLMIVEWLVGEENTVFLNTQALSSGIYVVEIVGDSGEKISRKFVKQ